jgi:hypothetical protein
MAMADSSSGQDHGMETVIVTTIEGHSLGCHPEEIHHAE